MTQGRAFANDIPRLFAELASELFPTAFGLQRLGGGAGVKAAASRWRGGRPEPDASIQAQPQCWLSAPGQMPESAVLSYSRTP